MDWWIVKQLRAMVLTDLRDFVPHGHFESEVEKFKLDHRIPNAATLSGELRWGYLATILGKELLFKSASMMSARQVSASDVLMNLGLLASAEAAQRVADQLAKDALANGVPDGNVGVVSEQLGKHHIPSFGENMRSSIEQYLRYLTPLEAQPFLPLLGLSSTSQVQGASPMTNNFHFHGNVGAVQTGANAVAHIVQNLDAKERASLATALQQFKEAIEMEPSLSDQQRKELLETTQQCSSEIESESSDSSKLLSVFNVLGTSIQSIASAQPAYQVLKTALLVIGIPLP